MVRSKNLEVLDLLAKASSIMADGEVMQLENSSDVSLSKEKYLEIIFGKTAVLFSAACESAALINNSDSKQVLALRDFGKNLGLIFQIVDDILDYSSKEQVLGKDVGNDFFEGKVTLPIILSYAKASETDKKIINDLLTKNLLEDAKNQNDLEKILDLIKKYEGLEESKNLALSFRDEAMKNLEIFPDSLAKENLQQILNYSLERVF
jgi:octaprenyl-diphosphate synthase